MADGYIGLPPSGTRSLDSGPRDSRPLSSPDEKQPAGNPRPPAFRQRATRSPASPPAARAPRAAMRAHVAAAPPMSVMKSRRLMSNMGLPPLGEGASPI